MKKANIKKVVWKHRETTEVIIWKFDKPHTANYVINRFKNNVSDDLINWHIVELEIA